MTTGTPDEAAEWHRVAEERRRQLERLQDQTLYRVAATAVGRARRAAARVRRVVDPARDGTLLLARSAAALPHRLRGGDRERALRAALAALPPAPLGSVARADVTAVIVTARQPARLDALLGALERLDVATLVVDNAGMQENAAVVARHANARRIPLATPVPYAVANEEAIAVVTTPWLLLLNDDVLPFDDTWLDRMLAAVDADTVAVGAQLVHGRRGPLGGAAVDGTVQHAGIGFVLDGPLAHPQHLDRGSVPSPVADVRDVDAATAACLLVRTAAHRAVGGLHQGFVYGSEDVDLCLRLAAHGTLRVAMGAVLAHEEGATRLRGGGEARRARTARQRANRALLDARHAPQLRRRVVRAAGRPDAPPHRGRIALGVAGSTPDLLQQAFADHRAVTLTSGAPGALTVVTDPGRLPPAGSAAADVPLVGWVGPAERVAVQRWTPQLLARLDALLVVGTKDDQPVPDGRPETLPVHHVADASAARSAVLGVLEAPRWSVRTGAPSGRAAQRWGDTAVAESLAAELRAHGLVARVVGRAGWASPVDRAADVTVQLKGRGVAPVAEGQTNLVWVLSHPSEVAPGELDAADHVLAGSELLAERYRTATRTPITVLPQATDGRRFGPGTPDAALRSRVLFVGNTRSVARPVVLGAVDAGLPLTLIGSGWERYLDGQHVSALHVEPDELADRYRAADVVLNDHWEDMARWGLVSNRVYDALACGACVVSDEVPGMGALLDDAVVTVGGRSDVGDAVRRLLGDADARRERAARGQRAVLARHTWEHRAAALVRLVDGGA